MKTRVHPQKLKLRKVGTEESAIYVADDCAAAADVAALTVAVALLAAVAITAEHYAGINPDVAYSVVTTCGAHPLASVFRKLFAMI